MMIRIHSILLLLLIVVQLAAGQERLHSGLEHAFHYTPWQLSFNPAGISRLPADSLFEARIGCRQDRQSLSLSDHPERLQQYGASVEGYNRIGQLQLTGGLSWKQDLRKGVYYNFLLQPDYLVTAGDTLGEAQRVEEYRIYGKAAYSLTPGLTAGIGGDFTAANNKDDSDEKRFTGNAHTTSVTAGLLYEHRNLRIGLSAGYIHRTELLQYSSMIKERLYTYPLGFYLNMADFNSPEQGGVMRSTAGSNFQFRSTGNQWLAAAQAEWSTKDISWFNTLAFSRQTQEDNPDKSGNMKGWEEGFSTAEYQSRLTVSHGRWTHLVSPSLYWKQGLSDRFLQHINYESLSGAWETYATYRLASRTQARAELRYEAIQDYTPTEDRQAWIMAAGWYHHEEKFYSFPMTISQTAATLQGMLAYRYTFAFRRNSRLTLYPSFTFRTGYGTEENISQPAGTPETENKLPRSPDRAGNDYAARTAARFLPAIQVEFRTPIRRNLAGGIRLSGSVEQLTGRYRETVGNIGANVFVSF